MTASAAERASKKATNPENQRARQGKSGKASQRTSARASEKATENARLRENVVVVVAISNLMLSAAWCEEEVSSTTDTDNDRQRRGRLSPGMAIDHRNLATATTKNDNKDRRMTTADDKDLDE